MSEPLNIVHVEVTHHDHGDCMMSVQGELGLEAPYGVDFAIVRRTIPKAYQDRSSVCMQDVPCPLVSQRVCQMHDAELEPVFREESDASTCRDVCVHDDQAATPSKLAEKTEEARRLGEENAQLQSMLTARKQVHQQQQQQMLQKQQTQQL